MEKLSLNSLILLIAIVIFTMSQHELKLNRLFHVENESSDCAGLELRSIASEANKEHLEQLGNRLEASKNLCNIKESNLSTCSNLLVRTPDGRDQLDNKRAKELDYFRETNFILRVFLDLCDRINETVDQVYPFLSCRANHDWSDCSLDFDDVIQALELKSFNNFSENFVAFFLSMLVRNKNFDVGH